MSEKILHKIQKLLNQKRGEEELGNQGAAESFALKIQELLLKYKLEMSDVERAKETETNPIIHATIPPEAWGERNLPRRVAWVEELADTIGRHYFVRTLAMIDNNSILLVGRRTDVQIATYVFIKAMRTGLNISEAELAELVLTLETELDIQLWNMAGGNEDFRYSFFIGFTGSINDRLNKQREKLELEAGQSTALVRAMEDVDKAVEEINPVEDAAAQKRHRIMYRAFNKGVKFGQDVNISPNVMGAEQEGLHIGGA